MAIQHLASALRQRPLPTRLDVPCSSGSSWLGRIHSGICAGNGKGVRLVYQRREGLPRGAILGRSTPRNPGERIPHAPAQALGSHLPPQFATSFHPQGHGMGSGRVRSILIPTCWASSPGVRISRTVDMRVTSSRIDCRSDAGHDKRPGDHRSLSGSQFPISSYMDN